MAQKYLAKVIDNNDPNKYGRIKIYIEVLMWGLKPDMYPWAYPDTALSSFIPEIGDFVWIFFEDEDKQTFKKPFYQNVLQFESLNTQNKSIGSMTGSYPDLKYIWLKNGVSIALNSNQTEASISVGSAEIYINPSGEVHIKGSSGTLESSVLGETLKTTLEKLIDEINKITVQTAVGPSSTPKNALEFTAIKTLDVPKILSKKVKNN